MTDALHEHARMLARNLLRLQVCTIGEIAETLELEPPEVQELAVEVYDERAEQLTALRQIMNDIGEKRAGRQQQIEYIDPDEIPFPPIEEVDPFQKAAEDVNNRKQNK